MYKILMLASTCALVLSAQVPQVRAVQPEHGKVGTVLQANGLYLNKNLVDSVYLTDAKMDLMVKVLNQDNETIQFRIPPSVKPGRVQLVIKTAEGVMLQQPFYVQVEPGPAVSVAMIAEAKK